MARRLPPLLPALLSVSLGFGLSFVLHACGEAREPVGDSQAGSPFAADGGWRDERPPPSTASRPNLLVVVIDTLRRDACGLPDEPRGTMPWLEQYASSSMAFRHAVAPAPWTVPSLATLLTGLEPHEHRLMEPVRTPHLAEAVVTYAEVLREAYGYETAAFTDGPWMRGQATSLLQGFTDGSVERVVGPGDPGAPGAGFWLGGTPELVGGWLERRDASRPFFLLLHTFEAHDPYGPSNTLRRHTPTLAEAEADQRAVLAFDVASAPTPKERARVFLTDRIGRGALLGAYGNAYLYEVAAGLYQGFDAVRDAALVAEIRRAYDVGVRHVDQRLAEAMDWMEQRGLLENTLVVITSDHGEAFLEHGHMGHATSLYDELVHVPLVMRGPAPFDRPRVVESVASLADILPTFFDFAGYLAPSGRVGTSLLPVAMGQAPRYMATSSMWLPDPLVGGPSRVVAASARSDSLKYIISLDLDTGESTEQLFDLDSDPGERRNLARSGGFDLAHVPDALCVAIEEARDRLDRLAAAAPPLPGLPAGESSWQRPVPCKERD